MFVSLGPGSVYFRASKLKTTREFRNDGQTTDARRPSPPAPMAVQLRQQRFHAGARAALERRGEWARLSRSGGPAVGDWGQDPPVGEDQVRMVPSLPGICALAGGRDATAEPEDEDVLFGPDGAEPDLEANDNDDDDDNLAES